MTDLDTQLQLWIAQAAAHRAPTPVTTFEFLWMVNFAVKAAFAAKMREEGR